MKGYFQGLFNIIPLNEELFRKKRVIDNLNRLHIITRLFLIIISWLLVINLIGIILHFQKVSDLYLYMIVYGAFFLVNFYFLIVFHPKKYFLRKEKNSVRYYENIFILYMSIIMLFGCVISIIDQSNYENLIFFMLNIIVCSGYILIDSRQLLIPFSLSAALLFVLLPIVDAQKELYYHQLYFIFLFVPIIFLISRILYKSYCDSYESNIRLKEEMEINEVVNEHLKVANQQLEAMVTMDELTKVSNRRGLQIFIDNLYQSYNGKPFNFTAIMLDIDYFKSYNDFYGHFPGDNVLRNIGTALKRAAEESGGFVARWGGEEFIFIICEKKEEKIADICVGIQKYIEDLKIPHARSKVSEYVTLSMGASTSMVVESQDIQICIEKADILLYEVKNGERNGYIVL